MFDATAELTLPLKFPRIIGLYAPCAQSGKSTVTAFLEVMGAERHLNVMNIKISAPIKEPLIRLGLCNEHIEGPLKEVPLKALGGKSPRQVMIELFKAGVEAYGPNWMADQAQTRIRKALAHGSVVVVDDVRTEEDYLMLRSFGADAQVWRVERPGLNRPTGAAVTESLLEQKMFDRYIANDGSLEVLGMRVRAALAVGGGSAPVRHVGAA